MMPTVSHISYSNTKNICTINFTAIVFLKSFNFRNTPFTRSCIKYGAPPCLCTKWLSTALPCLPRRLDWTSSFCFVLFVCYLFLAFILAFLFGVFALFDFFSAEAMMLSPSYADQMSRLPVMPMLSFYRCLDV